MIYPFSKINYLIPVLLQNTNREHAKVGKTLLTMTHWQQTSWILGCCFPFSYPSSFIFSILKEALFCIVFPALKKGVCTLFTGSSSPSHLDLLRVRGRVRLGSPRAWLLFLPLLLLLLPLGPQLSPWTATDMKTNDEDGCWLDPHTGLTLATIATNDSSST